MTRGALRDRVNRRDRVDRRRRTIPAPYPIAPPESACKVERGRLHGVCGSPERVVNGRQNRRIGRRPVRINRSEQKQTAQDAPGTTIGTGGDLQVYPISGSRMVDDVFRASTMIDTFREIKEAVDADVPVDAQNASTATWKTADSFPQAPTAIIFFWKKKEERRNEERRPNHKHDATQLSTKSDQVQRETMTVTIGADDRRWSSDRRLGF